MILVIGEILYISHLDKMKLGGKAFHFTYHLSGLGLPIKLVSRIGDDNEGREILATLRFNKIDTTGIQVDEEKPTPVNYVSDDAHIGDFHSEKYKYVPDSSIDYLRFNDDIRKCLDNNITLLYLSGLIQRSSSGHETIKEIVKRKKPGTLVVSDIDFDSNSTDIKPSIPEMLNYSDIVLLNCEKSDLIKNALDIQKEDDSFYEYLVKEFPVRWLITERDGMLDLFSGSNKISINFNSFNPELSKLLFSGVPCAYLTIFALGQSFDWKIEETLKMAYEFASDISKVKGALPYSVDFYEKYNRWMKSYQFN